MMRLKGQGGGGTTDAMLAALAQVVEFGFICPDEP